MTKDISIDEFRLNLSASPGGLFVRLLESLGLSSLAARSAPTRSVLCICLTWVPLLLLCLFEENSRGVPLSGELLKDLREWCRFFVMIPLLFVADFVIGPWLNHVIQYFVQAGLVADEQLDEYRGFLQRAIRLRDSLALEGVLLSIALGTSLAGLSLLPDNARVSWHVIDGQTTMAGHWYSIVALPVVRFLWLRWLLRLVIWWSLLSRIAGLPLKLVPTHPDLSGGLGFLSAGHSRFAILSFAISAQVASGMAYQIIYEGDKLWSFEIAIFSDVVMLLLLNLAPLFVFSPRMVECKRVGLYEYGVLAKQYVDDFHQKWIRGGRAPDEVLLGSSDFQSLADLGQGFENVKAMRPVPFDRDTVLVFIAASLIPFSPLLLTIYPFDQLLVHVLNRLL